MSTFSTDGGGFVIISQARPQDKENVSGGAQPYNVPGSMPKPLAMLYRGEPEVLGTVEICVGIILITFGAVLINLCHMLCLFVESVNYTGVLIWSGALYIISGSLSLAAAVKPTLGMVRSSLVMNIISIGASCTAIIMISIVFPSSLYSLYPDLYCSHYGTSLECTGEFSPMTCLSGTLVFLFLLSILMFCITISTSVFGCRTACRSSYNEMSVIIYQSTSIDASAADTEASPPSTTVLGS